jgi:hypothetical protein
VTAWLLSPGDRFPIIKKAVSVESKRKAILLALACGSKMRLAASSSDTMGAASVQGVGRPGSVTGVASRRSCISGSARSSSALGRLSPRGDAASHEGCDLPPSVSFFLANPKRQYRDTAVRTLSTSICRTLAN